jgi:predicted PurR-regulated permease PerM
MKAAVMAISIHPQTPSDVPRIMLLVIIIGLLLAGSLWTLLPFMGALAWATMIVVATWPLLLLVQRKTGGRRSVAVLIMTLVALAAFIGPLIATVTTLIGAADRSPAVLRDFVETGLGPPPAWVADVPVAGERIAARWQELAAGGKEALVEALRPYAKAAATAALAFTGSLGGVLLHVLLTLVIAAILYAKGEVAARGVLAFAYRIGGERGEGTVRLAGQAVRSVALGVIVTALVQSALAGLGLWICGVPHPGVLTAIAFVLGVAQLGPLLVLAPAVAWLIWSGEPSWGVVLLIWSIPVIALDNVLRPILIRRGVALPMLLIIAGVIGGLIGFGVIGLFVGPVILAASYTLLGAWIAEARPRPVAADASVTDAATTPEAHADEPSGALHS